MREEVERGRGREEDRREGEGERRRVEEEEMERGGEVKRNEGERRKWREVETLLNQYSPSRAARLACSHRYKVASRQGARSASHRVMQA